MEIKRNSGRMAAYGLAIGITSVFLAGCESLPNAIPNTVRVEVGHTSHLTQHEPFTNHPTNFGWDTISITAKWYGAGGWYTEVSEGYAIEEVDGKHEVFNARVGREFRIR